MIKRQSSRLEVPATTINEDVCVVNELIEINSVSIDGTKKDPRWLHPLANYDFIDS